MATTDPQPRKKSPRAPSIPLDQALEKVFRIYEKERLQPTPADVVAQHMGYKDANNGRALGALASLRYYGLVERQGTGQLSVTQDVEHYKFAPNDDMRRAYLRRFLAAAPLFAELLDRFAQGLPSDDKVRQELMERDFLPGNAQSVAAIFRRSTEFAQVFSREPMQASSPALAVMVENEQAPSRPAHQAAPVAHVRALSPVDERMNGESGHDRIPVRLSGGRRAWLVIPHEFHEADKVRLKAQIDLLLTDDAMQ